MTEGAHDVRVALTEALRGEPVPLRERSDRVGDAIEAMIRAIDIDGTDEFRETATAMLLESERRRIEANRSMFGGMGWEDVSELRDVSALRAESTQPL